MGHPRISALVLPLTLIAGLAMHPMFAVLPARTMVRFLMMTTRAVVLVLVLVLRRVITVTSMIARGFTGSTRPHLRREIQTQSLGVLLRASDLRRRRQHLQTVDRASHIVLCVDP